MSIVLETHCLTKRFKKQFAVNKVDMQINKGDIYGLIGKNGAGKTTIMKMVSGLISPTQGDIKLFESEQLNKGRQRIGCVIEQPALYPGMTARQNLMYYDKLIGVTDYSNVDAVLKLVGLEGTGKKKTKNFSLGMKQRLSIAIALLGNPDFLILDEPMNGLDPSGIKEIRELLLKLNCENDITILISSHILGELAKITTKYGVVKDGAMVDEFSAQELEMRCKKCLSVVVDDTEKASYILKDVLKSNDFTVFEDGKICIYDCCDIPGKINTALVKEGITVSSLGMEGKDLESYFVNMMGGEHV